MVLGVQPPPLVHRPPQQASVGAKTRSATGASAHQNTRTHARNSPTHRSRRLGRKRGPTPDRRPVLRPKPCPRADWTSKEKLPRTVIFSTMCGETAGGLLAGNNIMSSTNETPAPPGGALVRVLVADDQALFRRGLSVVLSASPDIEVVGEASDGEEAVAKAHELSPDVVLMDVRMPRLSGIEATRQIRSALPATEVLMLTVSDEEEDLYESVKAGANGYLLKEIAIEEIGAMVRAIVQHQGVISPFMTSKLLAEFRALAKRADERVELAPPGLTDREMQVLRLMAQSKSNKEIAKDLFISENTVKNHVRNILEKLHLHSRMEAVTYAWRKHLLDPREHE